MQKLYLRTSWSCLLRIFIKYREETASGIPASEFYLSQTKTYLEGKFYKDAFSEGAVKVAAKYTLILKPGK
jgi:hypothetical protein